MGLICESVDAARGQAEIQLNDVYGSLEVRIDGVRVLRLKSSTEALRRLSDALKDAKRNERDRGGYLSDDDLVDLLVASIHTEFGT